MVWPHLGAFPEYQYLKTSSKIPPKPQIFSFSVKDSSILQEEQTLNKILQLPGEGSETRWGFSKTNSGPSGCDEIDLAPCPCSPPPIRGCPWPCKAVLLPPCNACPG